MKKTLLTIMVTLTVTLGCLITFLSINGCISIEKNGDNHIRQVYYDGNLIEETHTYEFKNYIVKVHFNDKVVIGKN